MHSILGQRHGLPACTIARVGTTDTQPYDRNNEAAREPAEFTRKLQMLNDDGVEKIYETTYRECAFKAGKPQSPDMLPLKNGYFGILTVLAKMAKIAIGG